MKHVLPATLLLGHCLPPSASTWYVNGASGSDTNSCTSASPCKTLNHAISLAASGDTIRVAAATYAENLVMTISVHVIGASANTTIIDGGGRNTVVTISSASANVTLSGVTIQTGYASQGGGVQNNGTLRLSNAVISANTAHVSCGSSFCGGSGGGIYNGGTLSINNSTIMGNRASVYCTNRCATLGGGIFNEGGTVMISNSTILGNICG